MLKLTFYNLSVELATDNHNLLTYINNFLQKHYTQHQQKGFSKNQISEKKLFSSKIKDQLIYMFHTNQFIHLYHYLDKLGYKFVPDEKIDKRDYTIIEADMNIRNGWELRDYQVPIVDFLLDNPSKSKLVPIQTGKGKEQKLSSCIKVPGGWSTMGEMKVGTIVTAWDGSPSKVIGVYPQGIKTIYKITFADGRSTECGVEHLWKVYYIDTSKHKCWRVVNTLEVMRLISLSNFKVYIPLCLHEECKDISLPIHPYILGVFLGNGYLDDHIFSLTNSDEKVIDRIKNILSKEKDVIFKYLNRYTCEIIGKIQNFNPILNNAKKLGFYGKTQYKKFIPDIYLYSASYQQKLELLQGLMDVNGHIDKFGKCLYITSSYLLAKQLQYLIRSIGGIASILLKQNSHTYKNSKEQAYQVNISYNKLSELFSLPRKKERVYDINQYAKDLKLRVMSVEYTGEEETQCISIDHPDQLYITDDFIVTHNTFTALHTIAKINQRLGIIILPVFIEKWIEDIVKIHEARQTDVMVIQGFKALASVIELAKTNSLDNNYFIFSTRTMQDFISQYEENPELCVDMYGCSPIDLFPLLGIGVALIDETHAHFHAIFKIIIYTNVKFHIGLSATLMSDDNLITKMHKIVYPDKCVYEGGKLDRYTDVYAISYTISEQLIKLIKTRNFGSNNYSHVAFEQSILRQDRLLQKYTRVITTTIDDYYINDYKEQDKVIIFVSTVALATHLTNTIKEYYPEFQICRYCEEDSYEEMLNGDIIISTPISAGTALDIPRLRVAINTVSISSAPTNIQILGRLRKLKDRDVKFCYLYANNIGKQKEYHLKRVELFRSRVANLVFRSSSVGL